MDLTALPDAVRKAGFTPGEMRLVASGTFMGEPPNVRFQIRGWPGDFPVRGAEKFPPGEQRIRARVDYADSLVFLVEPFEATLQGDMSQLNIRVLDRRPQDLAQLESQILNSGIRFVAPDVEHASLAALARMKFPLNLGDCFAYALAKTSHLEHFACTLSQR